MIFIRKDQRDEQCQCNAEECNRVGLFHTEVVRNTDSAMVSKIRKVHPGHA
jgi:hypothetical protein